MKIISILSGLSTAWPRSGEELEQTPVWVRDPLAHPDIDAMSERELADLPFARGARPSIATDTCRG